MNHPADNGMQEAILVRYHRNYAFSPVSPRRWPWYLTLLTLAISAFIAVPCASGFVKIDFEQRYLVHPTQQIWDFNLVRPDTTYHAFYHTLPDVTPYVSSADTIWHATSPDLAHWTIVGPALTVGPQAYDEEAMWAPDVFWDEDNQRWVMAYTGVDMDIVQRPCLAFSDDLYTWTKAEHNPVFEPNTEIYAWSPDVAWSDFRDPFIYNTYGVWNMLSTAALRDPEPPYRIGVIHHAQSTDLIEWRERDVFFVNDGDVPEHVMESCQYLVRGEWHHLLFGEYDVPGISHVCAADMDDWTIAERTIIDWGIAPEINEFDEGVDIFSRLAPIMYPGADDFVYIVRFDTLSFDEAQCAPQLVRPHPLLKDWDTYYGFATFYNPTFGDNPAVRGEDSCGLVGYGWYGSREAYQGPLSGVTTPPGTQQGDGALGTLTSRDFIITGNRMKMLVGGGNYPETCYIAMMDAEADTIIFSETGNDHETMTWRTWALDNYVGREVYLVIEDAETGPFGHINVDEIEEYWTDEVSVNPASPAMILTDHGARPNPFNPVTEIQFSLARACEYQVQIHDLRGRVIWESAPASGDLGRQSVTWHGVGSSGEPLPTGTYVYGIRVDGVTVSSGKLSLVK